MHRKDHKLKSKDLGIPPPRGKSGRPNETEDMPVSLAPLAFEDVMKGLFQIDPEALTNMDRKPARQKQSSKKRKR